MINTQRKYENRYWLVNDNVYKLHFIQFYDKKMLEKFQEEL